MEWVWIILVVLSAWVGVVLTVVMLPGMWVTVLAAVLANVLMSPTPRSWWVVGAVAVLAVLGELAEMGSSAAGAKKFGASKSGMAGALIGSIAGAVAGTVLIPVPILGTLIGAIAGAGVVTGLTERGVAGRTWKESATSATGAAAGRAVAVRAGNANATTRAPGVRPRAGRRRSGARARELSGPRRCARALTAGHWQCRD
jgi:uncharacterized protein YqgC (DUF456 family)